MRPGLTQVLGVTPSSISSQKGNQMALSQRVAAIPAIPGVPALTCHVATWYWAAMEAQAAGRSTKKTSLQTMINIASMVPAPQPAILALPRSGTWDFNITPQTPFAGCVLLWPNGGTHSAVVTSLNTITGYNQPAQFPHLIGQVGYTSATPTQLAATQNRCFVISETTIINRAVALDL